MKFAAISDVHVLDSGDEAYKLLLSFITNPLVRKCDSIFFLGDIFDLMVGRHQEYLNEFADFFLQVSDLAGNNVKIHYFEGNHDFHLRRLFNSFLAKREDSPGIFFYHKGSYREKIDGKEFLFCHGDEIQPGQYGYIFYKRFVNNLFMEYVADYIMPYKILHHYGESASQASRKKNFEKYNELAMKSGLKEKIKIGSENEWRALKFDVMVCGHSHIKEMYESQLKFSYINNGFALESKTFIYHEDGKQRFEKLV